MKLNWEAVPWTGFLRVGHEPQRGRRRFPCGMWRVLTGTEDITEIHFLQIFFWRRNELHLRTRCETFPTLSPRSRVCLLKTLTLGQHLESFLEFASTHDVDEGVEMPRWLSRALTFFLRGGVYEAELRAKETSCDCPTGAGEQWDRLLQSQRVSDQDCPPETFSRKKDPVGVLQNFVSDHRQDHVLLKQ